MAVPRLRNVEKMPPPFPLGKFPRAFVDAVAKEVVYMLATSRSPALEGPEWERIFAKAIGADWKPSNVGLDDIVFGPFAWAAKTVKNPRPHEAKSVRLISGRNNPEYSFGSIANTDDKIGKQVLEIWNGRVDLVREKYRELRSVVLVKPPSFNDDLLKFTVFEKTTETYLPTDFVWKRNTHGNLEGYHKKTQEHKFTWQRHGSQFTVKEDIPTSAVHFTLNKPEVLDFGKVLKLVGYDPKWVRIVK